MDTIPTDCIVIGAGIAGASAAAFLALDRKVVLVEAEEAAGYHTTGRSAALWILNYGPPDVRALTGASRDFFETPPPGFSETPLLAHRPVLTVASAGQEADFAEIMRVGVGLRPITVEAVRDLVPAIRPGSISAAMMEDDTFDMDVAALHQGFLRQLRQRGGALALRSRTMRIAHRDGAWQVEVTGGGSFRAPVLVNAAGAWGDEVAGLAGLAPLGLQPKRRTALIIDPGAHDCTHWPLLGDAAHGWYVRPEARRKLLVSPADETDMPPHDVQPDEIDVAIAVDRMQQALDIPVQRVEHRWAGLRSFLPDRSLAIGAAREAAGFFWMIGQGGYGIQTAPAAGALLAALVRGADPGALAPILPLVDPGRFRGDAA